MKNPLLLFVSFNKTADTTLTNFAVKLTGKHFPVHNGDFNYEIEQLFVICIFALFNPEPTFYALSNKPERQNCILLEKIVDILLISTLDLGLDGISAYFREINAI